MKKGETITSIHNPKIKSLLLLEKPRERRKQCLFVIEGLKEIGLAIKAGYKIGNLFYCEQILAHHQLGHLAEGRFVIPVSKDVFDKIAVRENSGGVIAVSEMKPNRLEDLKLTANPLVLVVESVEKPGNLGAILRTADAAGVDAVISCDPQTDFYNHNVIRSSIGCVFTQSLASSSSDKAIAWLKENKIKIFCAYLNSSKPYHQTDFKQASAIVMGTESTGLSDVWLQAAEANIIIPMFGKIDSMNVSASAAVLVFEAVRQRST